MGVAISNSKNRCDLGCSPEITVLCTILANTIMFYILKHLDSNCDSCFQFENLNYPTMQEQFIHMRIWGEPLLNYLWAFAVLSFACYNHARHVHSTIRISSEDVICAAQQDIVVDGDELSSHLLRHSKRQLH